MLGSQPAGLSPPNPANAVLLSIPNSGGLYREFCCRPSGEYEVEKVSAEAGEYRVLVKKPNGKLDPDGTSNPNTRRRIQRVLRSLRDEGCRYPDDFTVWVFEPDGSHWMPRHMATLEAFARLEISDREKAFRAIASTIVESVEPDDVINSGSLASLELGGYPCELVLKYLKWMAALEDTLYPPICEYLGRRMAFAGYVLAHSGRYTPTDIGKLLKAF